MQPEFRFLFVVIIDSNDSTHFEAIDSSPELRDKKKLIMDFIDKMTLTAGQNNLVIKKNELST